LEELAHEPGTVIAYESPHRILATLEDITATLGDRPVVVAREITKIHEEFLRGTALNILDQLRRRASIKGEVTLLIGRQSETAPANLDPVTEIGRLQTEEGLDRMEAIKTVAKRLGLPKREVYRLSAAQNSNPPDKRRG
jgi:16S rRNA (cytidine1402-2'-O)-methyltransferase